MGEMIGKTIKESDRDELTAAAYEMQNAYQNTKTWYEAIHLVHEKHPTVMLWLLEGMWRAIDAYVDINE